MKKYLFKNRIIYSLILNAIIGVLSIVFIVKPNIEAYSNNLLLTSVYENSNIDYDIPSPTKDQLQEIRKLDFVDKAFGYFYTEGALKIKSKYVKEKIIFSDDLDSLEITMYNDKRLIITSQEGIYKNPVYVDYDFYIKNDLSIGDVIHYNNIELQVGRVYETNTYYGSAIFIPLVGEQKNYIESLTKSYSGAYLKVNDSVKAESYLKNYKPLGRLKDRSDFASDEEYQIHYNFWNNANYYNEITSFSSRLAATNLKAVPSYFLGFIILSIIMLIANIVLSMRKSERIYFNKKKYKGDIRNYYIATILIDAILMMISLVVSIFIVKNSIITYVPNQYFTSIIVAAIAFVIGVATFNVVYDIFFCKKIQTNK